MEERSRAHAGGEPATRRARAPASASPRRRGLVYPIGPVFVHQALTAPLHIDRPGLEPPLPLTRGEVAERMISIMEWWGV